MSYLGIGVPCVCVASPAWSEVGVGPGLWWRSRPPCRISLTFVVGVRCPVVGSSFARIPTHRMGSRCRPGLGFHIHAVPPPLGSRRRPWPPYPALGWGWSVRGSHPTTGRSSSSLAIRPIGGLCFVSMGRGWGVSALASFATSALGSGVVRKRVGRDKKARNGARHASCSVSVTHRAGLPLPGSPLLFPPLLLPPRSVR